MNLAVGLTPAWQHVLVFDDLQLGGVHRASEVDWCASGKVLNVGVALHRLGGESRVLAPLGGPTGEAAARDLESMGVSLRQIASATPTRVCTTILRRGADAWQVTELVEDGGPLGPGEHEEFLRVYTEEAARARVVVLAGSLPTGTPGTFYRDVLERTSAPVIIDGRGEELLAALEREPYLVKPNRRELAWTLGRKIDGERQLRDAMEELNRRGAAWVVVTEGEAPIWIRSRDGALYRLRPPKVPEVNSIGCGDSMAAALAWAIGDGREVPEAVRLGAAAATQNLVEVLPARIDRQTVESIARDLEVESVGAL